MSTLVANLDDLTRAARTDGRVDVVKLANNLGIEVFSKPMLDKNSGSIQLKEGKPVITVNRLHPATRQRFTIAHEIGHYLKHQPVLEKTKQLDRAKEAEVNEKIEAEADKIAAEILMPKYMIDELFAKKGWNEKTKFDAKMINKIADMFFVSKAMVINRLRDLKFHIPYISFA